MKDLYINLSRIISKLKSSESANILGCLIIERDSTKNTITICMSYDMTPIVFIEDNKITHIDLFVKTCPILYQWAGLEVTVIDDMLDTVDYDV